MRLHQLLRFGESLCRRVEPRAHVGVLLDAPQLDRVRGVARRLQLDNELAPLLERFARGAQLVRLGVERRLLLR
jgi:hypothetical protein